MGELSAKPVRRRPTPKYPTKLEVLADGRLLQRHVPPSWLSRTDMAKALSVFLAANTGGCLDDAPVAGRGAAGAGAAIVAPIFEHGEGKGPARGALGCIAVAAPVFLSEEEALQVIREELARVGVDLSRRGVVLGSVRIRGHKLQESYEWLNEQRGRALVEVNDPLELDLSNAEHSIGVEYVALDDFDPLGGQDDGRWVMDIRAVASSVAENVENQGEGLYFGAFYDPVVYYRFDEIDWASVRAETNGTPDFGKIRSTMEKEPRAKARRLLRQQVKDFVDWLKAQGAI